MLCSDNVIFPTPISFNENIYLNFPVYLTFLTLQQLKLTREVSREEEAFLKDAWSPILVNVKASAFSAAVDWHHSLRVLNQ